MKNITTDIVIKINKIRLPLGDLYLKIRFFFIFDLYHNYRNSLFSSYQRAPSNVIVNLNLIKIHKIRHTVITKRVLNCVFYYNITIVKVKTKTSTVTVS